MSHKISINQLSDTIMSELNIMEQDVIDHVNKATKKVAASEAKSLRTTSPVRSDGYSRKYPPGAYAKSWTQKVTGSHLGVENRTVYNSKHYQIAHLLEHGHVIVTNGKRYGSSRAIEHIAPVEKAGNIAFEQEIRGMKL